MRTVGRPTRQMVLEDPYREATGVDLRTAILDWDARGIKLAIMADRIHKATGHTICRSSLFKLIRTYRSAEAAQ